MQSLKVADIQVAKGRIMMPGPRKGPKRKPHPPAAIPIGAEVMDKLQPSLARHASTEVPVWRWVHKRVGKPNNGSELTGDTILTRADHSRVA